jgi:hypothetical protein
MTVALIEAALRTFSPDCQQEVLGQYQDKKKSDDTQRCQLQNDERCSWNDECPEGAEGVPLQRGKAAASAVINHHMAKLPQSCLVK